ncbi:TPA: PilZ domain-containing protein [Neisseria meningitidis]|uniref:PilZ domain-containing protein n=1 Tax=Neisseria lactamica TaxID=486 RepID=UPI00049680F8|nr:PilZ domain-containing protein [Neisseria lactamica]
MSDGQNIPVKMMSLKLQDMSLLYKSYMPFLEYGGLFVQTDDVLSIGEDILLAVEILNYPKLFLPTQVAWINPARTSSKPKGVGLAFTKHENCLKVKDQIEVELGSVLGGSRPTFTM